MADTLLDLIKQYPLLGEDTVLDGLQHFSFTWDQGYFTYKIQYEGHGSLEGAATYHPDGVCVGNPCEFCGYVMMDEWYV